MANLRKSLLLQNTLIKYLAISKTSSNRREIALNLSYFIFMEEDLSACLHSYIRHILEIGLTLSKFPSYRLITEKHRNFLIQKVFRIAWKHTYGLSTV